MQALVQLPNVGRRAGALVAAFVVFSGGGRAAAQGADLIVGDIQSSMAYVIAGSPKAYSLGVTFCNLGGAPVNFQGGSALHPIVTQNMYRLQNGRFEQVGQAWA